MRRKLHSHPIPGTHPHKIHCGRARCMRHHHIFVRQLQTIHRTGEKLPHRCLTRGGGISAHHGLVKTHGPSAVTATVCSKCAEYFPSSVTAAHLSGLTLLPGAPAFTIGSIARTIPSFNRGFSFRRSM